MQFNSFWLDDVPNLHCGQCVHWDKDCRRIDHKTVKFAVPWFKSYDQNQHSGIICSDFYPREYCVETRRNWTGFNDYWAAYVDQWLPYKNTNILIYFTLHENTSIRYGVPLMDYVNGTMIADGILMAVEKQYTKRSCNCCYGYEIARESINSVRICDVAHSESKSI